MHDVSVVGFRPEYLDAYVRLNLEWIQKHFWVEAADRAQLENPKENILDQGGEIFFVLEDGSPVGTCAMVPHGPQSYELAKMAVDPRMRSKGYGDLLMKSAVSWAKNQNAKSVTLLSNTVLEPAILLYKKHGFITKHLGQHPDYERCNIEMELIF